MTLTVSGTLAALAGPLLMVFGLYIWERHWKSGSAFALNLFKCCTASAAFIIASFASRSGVFFPADVFTLEAIGFLFLSSTIGILVGDWAWLEAQQKIGTLRVVLVDTTKPFLAALLGWIILKEELGWEAFVGMTLTILGVLIVTLDNNSGTKHEDDLEPVNHADKGNVDPGQTDGTVEYDAAVPVDKCVCHGEETNNETSTIAVSLDELSPPRLSPTNSKLRYGYIMAVLNVSLDTYGSLLTKQYGVGMTTWEISLLRFGFAGVVMLFVSCFMHMNAFCNGSPILDHATPWYALPSLSKSTWLYILAGVGLVTFLTPALSNFALFQIPLALAITLGSIGPIYALPLDFVFKGNTPTTRSVLGCTSAVGGIVFLTLRGTSTK